MLASCMLIPTQLAANLLCTEAHPNPDLLGSFKVKLVVTHDTWVWYASVIHGCLIPDLVHQPPTQLPSSQSPSSQPGALIVSTLGVPGLINHSQALFQYHGALFYAVCKFEVQVTMQKMGTWPSDHHLTTSDVTLINPCRTWDMNRFFVPSWVAKWRCTSHLLAVVIVVVLADGNITIITITGQVCCKPLHGWVTVFHHTFPLPISR